MARQIIGATLLLSALTLLTGSLAGQGAPPPGNRRALVIGNNAYARLAPLLTPRNDAAAITEAMRNLQFEITQVFDVDLNGLVNAIEKKFVPQVQPGDTCLIYFSGYGVQFRGDSWLLPVDFHPNAQVDRSAYSISLLISRLERRQAGLKILIAETGWEEDSLLQKGYVGLAAPTETPAKTLLALAHQPGRFGAERSGSVGLFTKAVISILAKPGLQLGDVFNEAESRVLDESGKKQQPSWIATSGVSTFYLRPPIIEPPRPVEVREIVREVPQPLVKGATKLHPIDNLNYSWIPPGEFKMGCVPTDKQCLPNEQPQHLVQIPKGFWMTRSEVTVGAFEGCVLAGTCRKPGGTKLNPDQKYTDHPVTKTRWEDAQAYCRWVGGTLPSEAEWEYAARGGQSERIYPWGDTFQPAKVNSIEGAELRRKRRDRRFEETVPVNLAPYHEENGFNLIGMIGNAREWTADAYDEGAYGRKGASADPVVPPAADHRVIRGGSFNGGAKHLRISYRDHWEPNGDNQTGFRCVVPNLP